VNEKPWKPGLHEEHWNVMCLEVNKFPATCINEGLESLLNDTKEGPALFIEEIQRRPA
jgi:hypothetical protein